MNIVIVYKKLFLLQLFLLSFRSNMVQKAFWSETLGFSDIEREENLIHSLIKSFLLFPLLVFSALKQLKSKYVYL
jgi:hypothetical protein